MAPRLAGRPKRSVILRETVTQDAVKWFAEKGFAGVSLREIARAWKVSAPTVVHHVGSKEELYARVLEHVRESLDHALMMAKHGEEMDAYLEWSLAKPTYARVLLRAVIDGDGGALLDTVAWRLSKRPAAAAQVGAIAFLAAAEPAVRKAFGAKLDLRAALKKR